MKLTGTAILLTLLVLLLALPAAAQEEERFDSEQMLSELEKQIQLSKDKLEQLKPVLEEKSRELQQSMHESVDKGFAEFDKLSEQFQQMSRDAEAKAREMMSSEEVQKLRDYLSRIDEAAIRETKNKMIAELTALLELTEEQVWKIKPILEDSFDELSVMLDKLAAEGGKSWAAFKDAFEKLSQELHDNLQNYLNKEQMEKLDKYNEEKKEKIQQALFTA